MKVGSTDIADIKLGATQVNKIYLGATKVWEKEQRFLDLFPGVESHYSLTQDNDGELYPIVKVRRSNNDESFFNEKQIVNGTLESFCGTGDGYISYWADQSVNKNHLVESAALKQPKIVKNGTLIRKNNKPVIEFDSSSNLSSQNSINYGTTSRSIFVVLTLNELASSRGIISLSQPFINPGELYILTSEIGVRTGNFIWLGDTSLTQNNISLLTNIYKSGDLYTGTFNWLNGNVVNFSSGSNGSINTASGKIIVGSNGLGGGGCKASYSQITIYKSDKSTQRQSIDAYLMNHYGI